LALKWTPRQKEIMRLCVGAAPLIQFLDIDELMHLLDVVNTKQSLQFSIRYLVRGGYLTKTYSTRRGRKRLILVPTSVGEAAVASL
jgi:hypothetical protein